MENTKITSSKPEMSNRLVQCGAITCIHNINENCNSDICDIYERTLKQEH